MHRTDSCVCCTIVNLFLQSNESCLCLHRCQLLCLQRGEGTEGEKNANAKKKWFEEKQKRKQAELERLGLDTTETHRIESAEQVRFSSCSLC